MSKVRKVIFKNTVDREAFIGLQTAYLTLPSISFERGQYVASDKDDTQDNGKPMLTVFDNLAELEFDEFTKIVPWDTYQKAEFDFTYLKKVPGSTRNLVDFTSSA